jgi:hypothetical protein
MGTYLVATGIILIVMLGWVAVQHMARLFAVKHPEFGPYPEGGGGCGTCGGRSKHCRMNTGKESMYGAKELGE